jgi:hypothetical protein
MQLARQPGFWRYVIELKSFLKCLARDIVSSCRHAVSNRQLSTLKCRWADSSVRTSLGDCTLVACHDHASWRSVEEGRLRVS